MYTRVSLKHKMQDTTELLPLLAKLAIEETKDKYILI